MIFAFRSLTLALVFIGAQLTKAHAEVKLEAKAFNSCTIRVSGEITAADAADTLPFLHRNSCKKIDIKLVNSPGGETSLYELLSAYLETPKVRVASIDAQGLCMSTCALIFVGLDNLKGRRVSRTANCDAVISFHKIYFIQGGMEGVEAAINQELLNRLRSTGVPDEILEAMILTEGSEIFHFHAKELSDKYAKLYSCRGKSVDFDFEDYLEALKGFGFDSRELFEAIDALAYNFVSANDKTCGARDWLDLEPMVDAHKIPHIHNEMITLDFFSAYNSEQLEQYSRCWESMIRTELVNASSENYEIITNTCCGLGINNHHMYPLFILKANGIEHLTIQVRYLWSEDLRVQFTYRI